ncbi:MAG: hypothetical protein KR126chlam6_01444, partial [Candidatus Anoxychlamydiales bacterium]|nr:hypothetical protein [Candidatus Anoxychlamydiales bacterium]
MLTLKQEFSSFFDFFDEESKLNEDSKVEKFQENLEKLAMFSEKIKDRVANGSEKEREELQDFLSELQGKIETEKSKLFEKIGVSEEDLKAFLSDKKNFSDEEWSAMQEMKTYLKQNAMPQEVTKKVKRRRSKTKW